VVRLRRVDELRACGIRQAAQFTARLSVLAGSLRNIEPILFFGT
jgi:hypothetical protein